MFCILGSILCCGMVFYNYGQDVVAEGKTKIVRTFPDNNTYVIIESKDDITAGDGARHDVIKGKASIATDTTCNVFRLLSLCKIPVAFEKQLDGSKFLARNCTMIPYEVVVRREAHGSYLKRHPELAKGHVFPQLIVEFFLKTNNKEWQGQSIPVNDPFVLFGQESISLFLPYQPLHQQKPFLTLDDFPLKNNGHYLEQMVTIAKRTFLILEKAWQKVGTTLVDFKVEFGFDTEGNLLLADVIDNDSWRVVHQGNYIDKQIYRDGGDLDTVTALYESVRNITKSFTVPSQQIIIWRASVGDDSTAMEQLLEKYAHESLRVTKITKSLHKDSLRSYVLLTKKLQEIPDSVIIVLVGRSNGAGPLLTIFSTVPVIAVPACWEKLPEDIWSSLHMPREVPLMTVLDQNNGMLAALRILAKNNPYIYALLREAQEKNLINIQEIECGA
jgi:phosphoribosylaminoimidazole carboxylase/phosphoribosylaminoimidazole-succinocarboxamide synthase